MRISDWSSDVCSSDLEMDRLEKSIYTAEDPVEYRIPYVTHVQMNESVGLDFARSIKAFMRSDPDVIILGEIREQVTASKAIQAAETGPLVARKSVGWGKSGSERVDLGCRRYQK